MILIESMMSKKLLKYSTSIALNWKISQTVSITLTMINKNNQISFHTLAELGISDILSSERATKGIKIYMFTANNDE